MAIIYNPAKKKGFFKIPSGATQAVSCAFSYSASSYTTSDPDPTPTVTGDSGGVFTSTAGIVINSATGEITLASSSVASYVITYTVRGKACQQTIEIASGSYTEYSFKFDGCDCEIATTVPEHHPVKRNYSFWYKHISYSTGTKQPLFCGEYLGSNKRYAGGAGILDKKINWSLGVGGLVHSASFCCASGDPDEFGIDITDGEWHHIFIYNDVVDQIKADIANTKIWCDGNNLALSTEEGNQYLRGLQQYLLLGAGNNGSYNSPTGDLYMNAYMDEFAYWTGTYIGDSAVTEIYNEGAPNDLNELDNASDPTAWYRMGENADWDTTVAGKWFLEDQGTSGTDAESVNLVEADRVDDTPE